MKRIQLIDGATSSGLVEKFSTSRITVSKALNYRSKTALARRIRSYVINSKIGILFTSH
ncbi:MAG: hypothetical protein LIR46_11510 [Bacteroidota bacterium]|nr:hypothetical protein [Bacteroidota bacterium]